MSKLSKHADKTRSLISSHSSEVVENFMAGNSYKLTPLSTLRIVAASSIFGEPQYYRDGVAAPKTIKNLHSFTEYSIFSTLFKDKKSATDVFTSSIDAALDYDYRSNQFLNVTVYFLN